MHRMQSKTYWPFIEKIKKECRYNIQLKKCSVWIFAQNKRQLRGHLRKETMSHLLQNKKDASTWRTNEANFNEKWRSHPTNIIQFYNASKS